MTYYRMFTKRQTKQLIKRIMDDFDVKASDITLEQASLQCSAAVYEWWDVGVSIKGYAGLYGLEVGIQKDRRKALAII